MLAEEEKTLKSAKTGNAKTATKKSSSNNNNNSNKPRGTLPDLSRLDVDDDDDEDDAAGLDPGSKKQSALNASGIDNALDALNLTAGSTNDKIDRHPERRFKAAYAAFEARRLPEIEEEMKGLRRQQRIEMVKKEFEKSPENPFNQVMARFDATKEEVRDIRERERRKVEERLSSG